MEKKTYERYFFFFDYIVLILFGIVLFLALNILITMSTELYEFFMEQDLIAYSTVEIVYLFSIFCLIQVGLIVLKQFFFRKTILSTGLLLACGQYLFLVQFCEINAITLSDFYSPLILPSFFFGL